MAWFPSDVVHQPCGSLVVWLIGGMIHLWFDSLVVWFTSGMAHWWYVLLAMWLTSGMAHWWHGSLVVRITSGMAFACVEGCRAYVPVACMRRERSAHLYVASVVGRWLRGARC